MGLLLLLGAWVLLTQEEENPPRQPGRAQPPPDPGKTPAPAPTTKTGPSATSRAQPGLSWSDFFERPGGRAQGADDPPPPEDGDDAAVGAYYLALGRARAQQWQQQPDPGPRRRAAQPTAQEAALLDFYQNQGIGDVRLPRMDGPANAVGCGQVQVGGYTIPLDCAKNYTTPAGSQFVSQGGGPAGPARTGQPNPLSDPRIPPSMRQDPELVRVWFEGYRLGLQGVMPFITPYKDDPRKGPAWSAGYQAGQADAAQATQPQRPALNPNWGPNYAALNPSISAALNPTVYAAFYWNGQLYQGYLSSSDARTWAGYTQVWTLDASGQWTPLPAAGAGAANGWFDGLRQDLTNFFGTNIVVPGDAPPAQTNPSTNTVAPVSGPLVSYSYQQRLQQNPTYANPVAAGAGGTTAWYANPGGAFYTRYPR